MIPTLDPSSAGLDRVPAPADLHAQVRQLRETYKTQTNTGVTEIEWLAEKLPCSIGEARILVSQTA